MPRRIAVASVRESFVRVLVLVFAAAAAAAGACGDDGAGGGADEGIPQVPYCASARSWNPDYAAAELEVLGQVNARRSEGADCGSRGMFASTGPLTMNGALRCTARVHSQDMADRGYFDHTNPDGLDPFDRMAKAGYMFSTAGENIAQGYPDADAVMQGWMGSDGHCSNIMNPDYTETGLGLGDNSNWTQTFGRP